VEVDEAALLVFGDFHEGKGLLVAKFADGDPGGGGEAAADGDRGASPQLGGSGVPDDGASVVVAVGAEGLADTGVSGFVALPAVSRPAVSTLTGPRPRSEVGWSDPVGVWTVP
jgi:hypothetical protein